jgi:class 3 adenylate cyclase/tetratricopeptide (TPR) repeat protein
MPPVVKEVCRTVCVSGEGASVYTPPIMTGALTCPACSATNDAEQRFCTTCGASLGQACSVCGTANSPTARFCGACGSPLEPPTGPPPSDGAEERKVVSVLFADLAGFTAGSDGADPEDMKARLRPYFARAREEIVSVGGTVEKFIGDAVVGLFGAPTSREDDAIRAVQAAWQITHAIDELNEDDPTLELAIRIAVDTGEVVVDVDSIVERGEGIATGDVMNTASRLQHEAPVGGVVVGERTYRLTTQSFEYEPLGPVNVRGKLAPIPIWRVVGLRSEQERPPLAPLIGRVRELELLSTVWDKVLADRRTHLVTVIGPPGIGKSRLVRELHPRLAREGMFLKGRCRPYGETTGYGAFGQQVWQLAGIFETDSTNVARAKLGERVASVLPVTEAEEVGAHLAILLGLSNEGAPDKQLLFHSVRRFVEAVAEARPTALVFEDIHWAEPALLELLESLASRLTNVPVFLITLARPDLLETYPTWGGGLSRYTAVHLEPLTDADAHELASALLVGTEEASGYADRLVHTSGGNPLFLEELAASVAERTADLLAGLPTTVQAIISARLDALPRRSRQVLQDAAVVGRIFWRGPLAALQGDESDLDAMLDDLERRDFIRRQPESSVLEDREFIFKHVLTREVAYGTLPRAGRRERHRTVAAFIERASGDRVRESASILAYHYREADDDAKAAIYLMMAADVASRAWAKQQAITLLGEAIEIAERTADRDLLISARLARASTLIDAARFADAVEGLDWLIDEADGRNLALAHLARARAAFWAADAAHVVKHSGAAAEIAERLDDREVQGRALAARCEADAMGGDLRAAFATWERATATWPVEQRDAPFARVYATRALMSYWAGDYETALKMATEAHGLGNEASNLEAAVTSACNAGLALIGLSRHEEGISWLDRAIELGGEWEERSFRFTARGMNMRAGAVREIGDLDAARAQSEEALELAKDSGFPPAEISARLDLLFSDLMEGEAGAAERVIPRLTEALEGAKGFHQFLWSIRLMAARAEAALLAGRPEDTISFARAALAEAEQFGRRKYECLVRVPLGRALLATGRAHDAADVLTRAVLEAERLGHLPSRWPALAALADAKAALRDNDAASDARAAALSSVQEFGDRLTDSHRVSLMARPDIVALMS